MSPCDRRTFLKFGAALPLALQSLNARAATSSKAKAPPRRMIFICNSLGFYETNFFPVKRGDLATSRYLRDLAVRRR